MMVFCTFGVSTIAMERRHYTQVTNVQVTYRKWPGWAEV
jgi:hypothetical protein